ncbi:bifunctional diguanylate cyclase/phosphohydrolase [Blastopirellula marina]|uniref:diguanylate cyclase n=1 Tax=Blastopirellula marina DSM 3645 TaxID=314230 RepID=A4A1V0_9BACT|nr:diguanylate cyclase [Blastopirellula marina]EAQ77240.1 probable response regulatory protein [Blastopirellula marina DSM 3645]
MDTDSSADFGVDPGESTDHRFGALQQLLLRTEEIDDEALVAAALEQQNQLVQVRLGVASSLFTALKAKHPPTAAHSLRVATSISTWAAVRGNSHSERDELEVAALLHDVGKLAVPDYLLAKPGKLNDEELALMDEHHAAGVEIIEHCCSDAGIMAVIRHAGAWFDGSKRAFPLCGDDIPRGARMLAIVDAFDAMITDQVYRRARSKDRALAELFAYAGSQFDPELVSDFCTFQMRFSNKLQHDVAQQWLRDLSPAQSNSHWDHMIPQRTERPNQLLSLFHENLFRNVHDGLIYVGADLKILRWNHATETLTGLSAESVLNRNWSPKLVGMGDASGRFLPEREDPLAASIQSGLQSVLRLTIRDAQGEYSAITAHISPVITEDGIGRGATLQLCDASGIQRLEEQLRSLHVKATRDPLTSLANRSELDRALNEMVRKHSGTTRPCSLIICDLDFFKRINDNYGHQAGDDALVSFASHLKRHALPGDIAARYGGEEFVLVCGHCDMKTAAQRAEAIRQEVAATAQPSLGGKNLKASFGVTELQAGDTPESMLNRADRALLQAKELGRNMVIQLGSGRDDPEKRERRNWWSALFAHRSPDALVERTMTTRAPLKMVWEKLRGFLTDHVAEVIDTSEQQLTLAFDGDTFGITRRNSDRGAALVMSIRPREQQDERGMTSTVIEVSVAPRRSRDRRRSDALQRARQLMASLQSYLMVHDFSEGVVGVEKEAPTLWDRVTAKFKRPPTDNRR